MTWVNLWAKHLISFTESSSSLLDFLLQGSKQVKDKNSGKHQFRKLIWRATSSQSACDQERLKNRPSSHLRRLFLPLNPFMLFLLAGEAVWGLAPVLCQHVVPTLGTVSQRAAWHHTLLPLNLHQLPCLGPSHGYQEFYTKVTDSTEILDMCCPHHFCDVLFGPAKLLSDPDEDLRPLQAWK